MVCGLWFVYVDSRRSDRSELQTARAARAARFFAPQVDRWNSHCRDNREIPPLIAISNRRNIAFPCQCTNPDARMSAVSPMAERSADIPGGGPQVVGCLAVPL